MQPSWLNKLDWKKDSLWPPKSVFLEVSKQYSSENLIKLSSMLEEVTSAASAYSQAFESLISTSQIVVNWKWAYTWPVFKGLRSNSSWKTSLVATDIEIKRRLTKKLPKTAAILKIHEVHWFSGFSPALGSVSCSLRKMSRTMNYPQRWRCSHIV